MNVKEIANSIAAKIAGGIVAAASLDNPTSLIIIGVCILLVVCIDRGATIITKLIEKLPEIIDSMNRRPKARRENLLESTPDPLPGQSTDD